MHNEEYPEIVYSKEGLLEKKIITGFLVSHQIEFQPVNNVYRDYEAHIKVKNINPKQRREYPTPHRRSIIESSSPLRSYREVNDHSTSHFDKIRAKYSPEGKQAYKKTAEEMYNEGKKSYSRQKLNGRSKSQIENLIENKTTVANEKVSKTDFKRPGRKSPVQDRSRIEQNNSQFESGNSSNTNSPLSAMTNVITNELRNFFDTNAAAMQGESTANIKESIRKLCKETLKDFGLDEIQEKIVLNQAMMNFESILLSRMYNFPETLPVGHNTLSQTSSNSPTLQIERNLSFGNQMTLGENQDSGFIITSQSSPFKTNTRNSVYTSPGGNKMGTNIFENVLTHDGHYEEETPTPKLGAFINAPQTYKNGFDDKYRLLLTSQHDLDNDSVAASINTGSNLVITTRKSTEQSKRRTEESECHFHELEHRDESGYGYSFNARGDFYQDMRINPNENSYSSNKMMSDTEQINNRKQIISQMNPSANSYCSPSSMTENLFDTLDSNNMYSNPISERKQQFSSKNTDSRSSNQGHSSQRFYNERNDYSNSNYPNGSTSFRQPNATAIQNQREQNRSDLKASPMKQHLQQGSKSKTNYNVKYQGQGKNSDSAYQAKSWNSSASKKSSMSMSVNEYEEFDQQFLENQSNIQEHQLLDRYPANPIRVGEILRNYAYQKDKKTQFKEELNKYERFYQQKGERLNRSVLDRNENTSREISRSAERSNSPSANRTFMFTNGLSETEQARLARRKQAEEIYNEHTRKALKKSIDCNNRKLESFRDKSSDKNGVAFEKLSTSQILSYHKIILQNTNFQIIENMRKAHPGHVMKMLNGTMSTRAADISQ